MELDCQPLIADNVCLEYMSTWLLIRNEIANYIHATKKILPKTGIYFNLDNVNIDEVYPIITRHVGWYKHNMTVLIANNVLSSIDKSDIVLHRIIEEIVILAMMIYVINHRIQGVCIPAKKCIELSLELYKYIREASYNIFCTTHDIDDSYKNEYNGLLLLSIFTILILIILLALIIILFVYYTISNKTVRDSA